MEMTLSQLVDNFLAIDEDDAIVIMKNKQEVYTNEGFDKNDLGFKTHLLDYKLDWFSTMVENMYSI